MKKIITTILVCSVALLVIFGTISCGSKCEHIYDDCADTECNECGEVRDSMHIWADASCEYAKSCTECGKTEGEPIGHKASEDDGNCLTAITCQRCPKIMTEAQSSHTQEADDGNCETLVKCTNCDFIIVTAKAHDFTGEWESDTEEHWHKCKNEGCSVTDTKESHIGGIATCMQGAMCTYCEVEYTEKDINNHASDKYTFASNGDTTHKKIHECNTIIGEEAHVVNTSEEITYTWSNNYESCTAMGICSLCEANVTETASSTDGKMSVSAEFTIVGFTKRYFNKIIISFNTDGGSEIASIVQLPGTEVTPPSNPTKPGYTFTGWNKEIPAIMPSGNVNITAKWVLSTYTVTWVDENGTVLELDEGLSYGETPTYDGERPYKASTEEYSYLFNGWTPSVVSVTEDKTYMATYEAIKIEELEGCTYKKGDVVNCKSFQITYCSGCARLIMTYKATITGLRGILDGTPVYYITMHCCGKETSITETVITGKE